MSLYADLRDLATDLISDPDLGAAVTVLVPGTPTTTDRVKSQTPTRAAAHAVFTGRVREQVDGAWQWANRIGAVITADTGVELGEGTQVELADGTVYRVSNVREVVPDGATSIVWKVDCSR